MQPGKRDPRLIDFARQMRKQPMPSESWLWHIVRGRRLGGFRFRRQAPIGTYIVDFVCEEARVIVELDGSSHDGKAAYDLARKENLESLGYTVLRIGSELLV